MNIKNNFTLILLALISLIGSGNIQAQVKALNNPIINVELDNNSSENLLIHAVPSSKSCVQWDFADSFELPANSKKILHGNLSGCGLNSYEFAATFIVDSAKSVPGAVNGVVFKCGSDIGGCSMYPTGFPVQLDGTTINFKDAGLTDPWTLIFY